MSKTVPDRTKATVTTTRTAGPEGREGYTELFVAPELLPPRSQPATFASDMFSFGMVLYDLHALADHPRPSPVAPFSQQAWTAAWARARLRDPVDPALPALLAALLSADPARRPSASGALASPYYTHGEAALAGEVAAARAAEEERKGALLVCLVCMEQRYASDGVACPSGQPNHFICDECLAGKLEHDTAAGGGDAGVVVREGHVLCAGSTQQGPCSGRAARYSEAVLARHLSPALFERYMAARREVEKVSAGMDARPQIGESVVESKAASAQQRGSAGVSLCA